MGKSKTKIVFFGTPEFAAGILKTLIENKFNVAAVFTQPDRKIGRRQEIFFSPVKKMAVENGIKIFQPENLRDSGLIGKLREIGADIFIVTAYGKILPKDILAIPKYGAINIHTSLLPKYRGASPVQCAILAGEKETGITLMLMNEKMDEGDILAQEKIEIGENETVDVLLKKLGLLGAQMIVKFISDWTGEKIKPILQNHSKATYCKPVRREDGLIDWNKSADEIYNKWRAYQSWPGIFSILNEKNKPKRLKLSEIEIISSEKSGGKPGEIIEYNQEIAIQTKKGLIILKKIQLEGKKEMDVDEFMRGYKKFVGSELR